MEFTREMGAYVSACAKLEAAGIAYEEKPLEDYKVSFKLSKDGMSCTAIIDFASTQVERQVDFAIDSFTKVLELDAAESAKKKSKRGN